MALGRPSEQELFVTQNQICSRNLLDALIANHGYILSDAEPLPEEINPKTEPMPPRPQCPQWFSIVEEVEPPQPKINDIKKAVARHFGIEVLDMESARRTAKVVYPRQVAMYLARALTGKSLPEIGRRLGGRDHTTILHGARKIEADIRSNWVVAYDVALVEAAIFA